MKGSKILTGLDTNTNDLGSFEFSRLAVGEYRVSAEKEEAGYLSTRPDIFTSRPALTVVLTRSALTGTTIIRFPPKAGVITGWVRDAATGRSIRAHLSLAPMSDGGWSTTGTSGRFKFRLLIPSNTAIKFGACAEGYKTWSYADPSNRSRPVPLQLGPGIEVEMDIKLEHIVENPQSLCPYGKF
jgi:hypothetical protein